VRKTILLLMAANMMLLPAGCWDARDINEKSLITFVMLDRRQDQYVFHVEVPNLALGNSGGEGSGGSGYEQYSFVSGAGATLAEARQNLDYKMDRPLFLGTVRSIMITEQMARYGIAEYMYRLKSDDEYRKKVGIVTTSADPKALLDSKPENNISIGYSIDNLITSLERDGRKITNTTSEVLESLACGRCFLLPDIGLDGEDITCTGYTIFHSGKYSGFIPASEAKGAVWIAGKDPKWNYVVPVDDFEATVKVDRRSIKMKPYYAHGSLVFDISFKFEAKIMYLSKDVLLNSQKEEQIRQSLQKLLLKDISDAVAKSKSVGCDYLGFHDAFRIHYPDELKKMDHWCDEYLASQVKISVRTSLEPGGLYDFQAHGDQKSIDKEF